LQSLQNASDMVALFLFLSQSRVCRENWFNIIIFAVIIRSNRLKSEIFHCYVCFGFFSFS
jgi:hypothetical protein